MNNDIKKLAIPIILQNLISFLSASIDTLMLTQLDGLSFSAVSLAGQIFFAVTLLNGGITSSMSVLTSQYYGKKEISSMKNILSYALWVTFLFNGSLSFFCFFFPEAVMSLLSDNIQLIEIGTSYLKIVALSYILYGFISVLMEILRSVHDVKFCMYLSFVAMACNGILNALMIFGIGPFPALGVRGCAYATSISRILQFVILTLYFVKKETILHLHMKEILLPDLSLSRLYASAAVPVVANEFFWALGDSILVSFIGRSDAQTIEVYGIMNLLSQFSAITNNGLISAICIRIGNTIGEGEDVKKEIEKVRTVAVKAAFLSSVIILSYIPLLQPFNHLSGNTLSLAKFILCEGAFIQIFSCLQCMNVVGILRGCGDFRFGIWNDMIFLWAYTIPLAYVLFNICDLSFLIIYPLIKSDQIIKYFTSQIRISCKMKSDIKGIV